MICSKLLITHSFIPLTPPLSSSLSSSVPAWWNAMSMHPLCFRRGSSRILVWLPDFSLIYIPSLEWPWSRAMWLSVGRKVQYLHLNGSTFKKNPEFTERGLQGSGTNEAAGIFLARYKLPFSWLEAAASTSYYFTEWKGLAIIDAIMLMVLPSCMFACPCLVSINPGEEWKKEKHHCRLREEKRPRIWASLFKTH